MPDIMANTTGLRWFRNTMSQIWCGSSTWCRRRYWRAMALRSFWQEAIRLQTEDSMTVDMQQRDVFSSSVTTPMLAVRRVLTIRLYTVGMTILETVMSLPWSLQRWLLPQWEQHRQEGQLQGRAHPVMSIMVYLEVQELPDFRTIISLSTLSIPIPRWPSGCWMTPTLESLQRQSVR